MDRDDRGDGSNQLESFLNERGQVPPDRLTTQITARTCSNPVNPAPRPKRLECFFRAGIESSDVGHVEPRLHHRAAKIEDKCLPPAKKSFSRRIERIIDESEDPHALSHNS